VTAHESLTFLGRSFRLHGALLEERVSEALELTDLSDRAGDRADSLELSRHLGESPDLRTW
jgi:ABC-2 type transport system ATP-binding protein